MQPQLIAGRYQVLRAIGRGGMGTVWLCRDEVLGRQVAVKQIGALPGESATETKRAMREARSAAALNHPNAVAVYDVVDHDGRPWLVMEYVEGQTLADEILRDGRLSPQRVADIGAQLAGALARAHERGIVHRDIKPGNVLIDKAGRPKISDFGIARGHGDEQLTQVGFITGTPGYLSPELARGGDPQSPSDVWALGATLYSAVEGQPPYEPRSNPIALLRAIASERPRPMTRAGALAPAIQAMMAEDPASRWDMVTCARRLGGIARITTVMPKAELVRNAVVAGSALGSTERVEPTKHVDPTRRLEVSVLAAAAPTAEAWMDEGLPVMRRSAEQRAADKRLAKEQAAERRAADKRLGEERTAEKQAAERRLSEQRAAEKRLADERQIERRAAEKRLAEQHAAERRVAGQRLTEQRAAERRLVEQRAAEKRSRDDAATEQQAADKRLADNRLAEDRADRAAEKRAAEASVLGRPQRMGGRAAHEPDSRRRLLPLVFIALLVVGLSGTYLLTQLGDHSGTPATAITTTSAARPSATTVAPAPVVTAEPAPNTDQRLASFLGSYYSDVTTDTGHTWGQLSSRMQRTALGRKSYDGFWGTIARVRVNSLTANASAMSAVANLTFTRNGGSTSTETHRFTFVNGGGRDSYLIDSDTRQ